MPISPNNPSSPSQPAVHWGTGGSDLTIRLREASIHRITPTANINVTIDDDDLDTLFRADTPDIWGVIINDDTTFTLNISSASSSGDQNISLSPGNAMLWWLSSQSSSQGIYYHGWTRALNSTRTAGFDAGRGGLSEAATGSSITFNCAIYQFVDCSGTEITLYSSENQNMYVGRVVSIDGYSGVCWTVTRVLWASQTLTSITVTSVFLNCPSCLGLADPGYNCNECINQECVGGVMTDCDALTETCECDSDGLLWYDGGFRDVTYFQTTYGAGDFCNGNQRYFFSSCDGTTVRCQSCAWCFENARFEDQRYIDSDFSCSAACCGSFGFDLCVCVG